MYLLHFFAISLSDRWLTVINVRRLECGPGWVPYWPAYRPRAFLKKIYGKVWVRPFCSVSKKLGLSNQSPVYPTRKHIHGTIHCMTAFNNENMPLIDIHCDMIDVKTSQCKHYQHNILFTTKIPAIIFAFFCPGQHKDSANEKHLVKLRSDASWVVLPRRSRLVFHEFNHDS